MTAWPQEFDEVVVYEVPMPTPFRGMTSRQGVLVRTGDHWGEFCPFLEYDDQESQSWLASALEACRGSWPSPLRDTVPVNCVLPEVGPTEAHRRTRNSGCSSPIKPSSPSP